jgi:hypothetical protein
LKYRSDSKNFGRKVRILTLLKIALGFIIYKFVLDRSKNAKHETLCKFCENIQSGSPTFQVLIAPIPSRRCQVGQRGLLSNPSDSLPSRRFYLPRKWQNSWCSCCRTLTVPLFCSQMSKSVVRAQISIRLGDPGTKSTIISLRL